MSVWMLTNLDVALALDPDHVLVHNELRRFSAENAPRCISAAACEISKQRKSTATDQLSTAT